VELPLQRDRGSLWLCVNLDSAHQLVHEQEAVAAFPSLPLLAPGSVVADGDSDLAIVEAAFHVDHVYAWVAGVARWRSRTLPCWQATDRRRPRRLRPTRPAKGKAAGEGGVLTRVVTAGEAAMKGLFWVDARRSSLSNLQAAVPPSKKSDRLVGERVLGRPRDSLDAAVTRSVPSPQFSETAMPTLPVSLSLPALPLRSLVRRRWPLPDRAVSLPCHALLCELAEGLVGADAERGARIPLARPYNHRNAKPTGRSKRGLGQSRPDGREGEEARAAHRNRRARPCVCTTHDSRSYPEYRERCLSEVVPRT
jgi:hypothetical protein